MNFKSTLQAAREEIHHVPTVPEKENFRATAILPDRDSCYDIYGKLIAERGLHPTEGASPLGSPQVHASGGGAVVTSNGGDVVKGPAPIRVYTWELADAQKMARVIDKLARKADVEVDISYEAWSEDEKRWIALSDAAGDPTVVAEAEAGAEAALAAEQQRSVELRERLAAQDSPDPAA